MMTRAALVLALATLVIGGVLVASGGPAPLPAGQPGAGEGAGAGGSDGLRERLAGLLEIEDEARLRDAYLRLVFETHEVLPLVWEGDEAPAGAHHFLVRPDAGDRSVWIESDDGERRAQVMRDEVLILREDRIDRLTLAPEDVVLVGTRRGVWMVFVGDAAAASVLRVADLEARAAGG